MLSNQTLNWMRTQRKEFSLDGESIAAQMLAERGFFVFFSRDHPYHGYDLMVYPNVAIEVKTSSRRRVNQKTDGFQFSLFRTGHSKRISEPILICLCLSDYDNAVPFIIPSEIVRWKNQLTIPAHDPLLYRKKWSHFCNAFDRIVSAGGVRFASGTVTDDFKLFLEAQNAGQALSFAGN